METFYLSVVCFILLLAVLDLYVGVSNDAVNFLNSAVGARVAGWKTLVIVASVGVLLGAMTSSGMMDLARHGVMIPTYFSFTEVLTVFLAVMVTDVIVLDRFNSAGMPTSTTVSLVFELFGAATLLALMHVYNGSGDAYSDMINTEKVLSVIGAIFFSVAVAFVTGLVLQWLARLLVTFQRSRAALPVVMLFGGAALTALVYFLFIKGLKGSPLVSASLREWVSGNTATLILIMLFVFTALTLLFVKLKIDIFKVVVLMGTFSLAMAFAGNDLVNFIGVPLAALAGYQDWSAAGFTDPSTFQMTGLMTSAKSSFGYLAAAGVVMILALVFSRKARRVVGTEVGLGRTGAGEEMFSTSPMARGIVRSVEAVYDSVIRYLPRGLRVWTERRLDSHGAEMEPGAAFDVVRAAVNLVVASLLIAIGTTNKLPLSTTYVTFMVAMGSSLADGAWGRDAAVFRVTGVLTVIGGWFLTAIVAFLAAALCCWLMLTLGPIAMTALMVAALVIVIRSNVRAKDVAAETAHDARPALQERETALNVESIDFVERALNDVLDGFTNRRLGALREVGDELRDHMRNLNRQRSQELALRVDTSWNKQPSESIVWEHLCGECRRVYLSALLSLYQRVEEHVSNGFAPAPLYMVEELSAQRRVLRDLLTEAGTMMRSGDYTDCDLLRSRATALRKSLKQARHSQVVRLEQQGGGSRVEMLYIDVLSELEHIVAGTRRQLRTARYLTTAGSADPMQAEEE